MKNTAYFVGVMGILVITTGCANLTFREMPQSATEFKELSKTTKEIRVTNISVQRDIIKVVNDLNTKTNGCFNFDFVWTNKDLKTRRELGRFEQKFRVKFLKYSAQQFQFVIQAEPTGKRYGPKMPPGGFYSLVGDIVSKQPGKTLLTLYSVEPESTDAVLLDWAQGGNKACPISYD